MQRIVKNSVVGAMCVSVGVSAMMDPIEVGELKKLENTKRCRGAEGPVDMKANKMFGETQQAHKRARAMDERTKELTEEQKERVYELAREVNVRAIVAEQVEALEKAKKLVGEGDKELAEMNPEEEGRHMYDQLVQGFALADAKAKTQQEELAKAAEELAKEDVAKGQSSGALEEERFKEAMSSLESGVANTTNREKFFETVVAMAEDVMPLMGGEASEEEKAKQREAVNLTKRDPRVHLGMLCAANIQGEVQNEIYEMALRHPKREDFADDENVVLNKEIDACVGQCRKSGKAFHELMRYVQEQVELPLHACSQRTPSGKIRFVPTGADSRAGSLEPSEDRVTGREMPDVKGALKQD